MKSFKTKRILKTAMNRIAHEKSIDLDEYGHNLVLNIIEDHVGNLKEQTKEFLRSDDLRGVKKTCAELTQYARPDLVYDFALCAKYERGDDDLYLALLEQASKGGHAPASRKLYKEATNLKDTPRQRIYMTLAAIQGDPHLLFDAAHLAADTGLNLNRKRPAMPQPGFAAFLYHKVLTSSVDDTSITTQHEKEAAYCLIDLYKRTRAKGKTAMTRGTLRTIGQEIKHRRAMQKLEN